MQGPNATRRGPLHPTSPFLKISFPELRLDLKAKSYSILQMVFTEKRYIFAHFYETPFLHVYLLTSRVIFNFTEKLFGRQYLFVGRFFLLSEGSLLSSTSNVTLG